MEKEEEIKKIADMLLNSGFVLSESEALNRAKDIVETEEKFKSSIAKKGIKSTNVMVHGLDIEDDKPISELMKGKDNSK